MGINSSVASEGVLPSTFKKVWTDLWFFLLKARQISGRSDVAPVGLSWSSSKVR